MMTADHRLALIQIKLERATQHIRELQAEVRGFLDAKPYEFRVRRDSQTRRPIYYVASVKSTPVLVAAIAGDVLHNLRSALDHLAYQLVLVGGGRPSKQTSFPIFDDAAKYKTGIRAKLRGMRPEAIKAIDAVKPFKGGNDILWRMHRLNNVDKHRLLIAVGSAYRSVNISPTIDRVMRQSWPEKARPQIPALFLRPADPLFPLKAGDELFSDAPDAEITDIQFRFDVAFHEPEVVEAEPLVETVHQMADLAANLIGSFRPHLA